MKQQPSYWKVLTRRKILSTEGGETETKLNRILGLYDLTALGVGSTLGAGVYVLAGQIAKDQAGPSVILSFAIAALASLLAGVCYAEFGARVPKAGSAYVYSYVCIGEFAAFVIGWNLILEYVIGTAAVCRGISLYFDTLVNDTLKTAFAEYAPIEVSFLGSYFDAFAFGLVIVFGIALAFGVETSAWANNFCTCVNISIILFAIIAGSIRANFANWSIDVNALNTTTTTTNAGEMITGPLGAGGFFPFGFTGTLQGAATCFFGFVGFDCIATTGEEVRNPRKNIPRSILLSLLIIFLCYFGVSMVLTLMVPYYRQDPNAPLPYAFKEVGLDFAMWIVAIGGLIGLLASLFGALFPLPRIMYSMAEDGLLFGFLGRVSPRFKVPVMGSIFAAVLTAFIAGLFDLAQLVSLLSIGTLLAYSVVAISITILRYMESTNDTEKVNGYQPISETTMLTTAGTRVTFKSVFIQLFNCKRGQVPNIVSTRIVGTLITIFCLLSAGIGLILIHAYDALINNQIWVLVLLGILLGLTFLVLLSICLQPRETFKPRISIFRVPFVPIVPAASVFINIYLMLQLDTMTWIRFGVWMIIGVPLYIACYCMHDLKSPEKRNPRRIAFEKALKSSGHDIDIIDDDDDANGDEKPKKKKKKRSGIGHGHLNGRFAKLEAQPDAASKPNGKAANGNGNVSQNQLSLKSLDEIVKMSDIGEDLIEMRHRNGKVFYIEDTRSTTSIATMERDDMANGNDGGGGGGGGGAGNRLGKTNEASEEEKSVIALLDDVLQGADDGMMDGNGMLHAMQHNVHNIHDYSRKFSVDSVMLPSVIETTIVATVHSSSDSSEHDLDDVPEDNEEQAGLMEEEEAEEAAITTTEITATDDDDKNDDDDDDELVKFRADCARLAHELIDGIFDSTELNEALSVNCSPDNLSARESRVDDDSKEMEGGEQETTTTGESERLERKVSEVSMASRQSIDDPMHSERFKNILSQLILQPQINSTVESQKDAIFPMKSTTKLKHSKSETDLVGIANDDVSRDREEAEHDSQNERNNDDDDNNDIPKPPKLDPMLYKTINSLNTNRVRPSLDKLIAADRAESRESSNNHSLDVEKSTADDGTMSFKTKLEAILQRGPSHRTQRRPEIAIEMRPPRAKTMIEIRRNTNGKENSSSSADDDDYGYKRLNGFRGQSHENLYQAIPSKLGSGYGSGSEQPNTAEQLIANARKTLRPVQNGAIS